MGKKDIKSITEPVRSKINISIILSCISVVANISSLMSMALLAKVLISGNITFNLFISLLLVVLILNLVSMYTRLKSVDISHFASYDLELLLRSRLTQHIAKMPLGEIYRLGQGTLIKVLQDDVKGIHAYVADAPPLMARAVIAPILIVTTLLFLSWKLTLFLIILVMIIVIIARISLPNIQDRMQEYNDSREKISASIIEFVQAMPIVKIFDSGTSSFKRYKDSLLKHQSMMLGWYQQAGLGYKISMCLLNPIPTLIGILWFGFYWWQNQQLDFIYWLAILLIGNCLIETITPFMFLQDALQKAKISIRRILEIESTPTLSISEHPQSIQKHDIEFDNVSFRYYDNKSDWILEEVSFFIKENTFTAIVGASGSGKSTLARLIPRFWDTTVGAIKIGGTDIKNIPTEELMNTIAFVFQDNFLFYDSIINNISYGLQNVDRKDVITAAKKAQAHEFICKLPNGYDTLVGEGGSFLSGGQRQRITIARAFLQNRPILILDEATAHADPENEALLIKAISQLIKNKTVIMIAHRLFTIRDAHQILVLDQGRIVEQGQHQDLLDLGQHYYKLWQAYDKAQSWQLLRE
ncbi:MAG: ATP-binding cassette domain-containing protein [Neisseriaceae bacterium]|nr:MAG: ATP-binding cassette domain-containing protein [Neisseriaceae bacterium]